MKPGEDRILAAIIILALACAIAFLYFRAEIGAFISDPLAQGWIGLLGLYTSIVGLAIAYHQIARVRSATEAVQRSSAALIRRVRSTSQMFEASEVKREIAQLKTNVEKGLLEAALQSLETVRNRFILLKELLSNAVDMQSELDAQLVDLDRVERLLREALSSGQALQDPVQTVMEIGKMQRIAISYTARFALDARTDGHDKID